MASISASPNPVGVYTAAGRGITQITFDSRPELGLGGAKLFVSDGVTEKEIVHPALNTFSGTIDYGEIEYGKTYTFTLKRPDLSALASTMVTTFDLRQQLAAGFSSTYFPQLRPQAIANLSVRPGVDVVLVTFKTALPTIPLIELRDASGTKIDARFALFGGMRSEHSAFFGEDRPLALETKHTIRIVASGAGKEVELNAEFITGSRTAEIFFDSVDVHDDGDPGLRGEGELHFGFGAGDADTTESLGEPWPDFGPNSISDDDPPIPLNKNISIAKAPRRLWIQTVATESDFTGLPSEGSFHPPPSASYRAPGSSYYGEEAYQEATATTHLEIEDTPGSQNTIPFELRTGDYDVDFVMNGRVDVDSKFGQFIAPKMHKARPRPNASAILTSPGDISGLSPTLNVADGAIVALGPDNRLYHRGVSSLAKRLGVDGWARIELPGDGTPTVVASAVDKLDVLLLRDDGAVLHSARSGKAKTGRWRNLGGDFRQLLTAVEPARGRGADTTVALFGAADDGIVHVRDTRSEGSDWTRLGDQPLRALTAATVPGAGAVLFAMGDDRLLRCFAKKGGRWRAQAVEKAARGDRPPQLLTAVVMESPAGDGSKGVQREVVIGAMSDDQRVQIFRWPGFPSDPPASGWEDAGSVQDLLIAPKARTAPRRGTQAKSRSSKRKR